jgi:2-polyprenyl-3-methyl-5-hydroxy-6-metoxy-1,4-benzoquinol methylase
MSIEKAYDSWSSQYDSNSNKTRDLDKIVTKKILGLLEFRTVLELGSGTGKNTEWLQTKASKILAVDFSEHMMKIAREKADPEIVHFQQADITKPWDWTADSYELITCNLILEHIEDLDFIFQQAISKLDNGGHFFISELHPFKQYKGSKARFETENGQFELDTFTHHISEFLDSAEKAGFKLLRLNEWFDEEPGNPPRILSLLFQKL